MQGFMVINMKTDTIGDMFAAFCGVHEKNAKKATNPRAVLIWSGG